MKSQVSSSETRVFFLGMSIAVAAGVVLTPYGVIAKKPEEPAIRYSVSQPVGAEGGLVISSSFQTDEQGNCVIGDISLLTGRAESKFARVIINRPSPAIELPMLDGFVDEDGDSWGDQNPVGTRYSVDCSGTVVIQAASGSSAATAVFHFRAHGKNGSVIGHRLNAEATITDAPSDPNGDNFPTGVALNESYTVNLFNFVLSHDSGSKKQAYSGQVTGAAATVVLARTQ